MVDEIGGYMEVAVFIISSVVVIAFSLFLACALCRVAKYSDERMQVLKMHDEREAFYRAMYSR